MYDTEATPNVWNFTIKDSHYQLFTNPSNFAKAKNSCMELGYASLAFFDTNDEYLTVSRTLTEIINKEAKTCNDVWVDINATDSNSDGLYEHWWKMEKFASDVWPSTEPSDDCGTKSRNPCCARMTWQKPKFNYLRDWSCDAPFSYLCKDVNECQEKTAKCGHVCRNKMDGYACHCNNGYQLARDNVTCIDVDECNINPCNQICTNTLGSFSCSCASGYTLGTDGKTCFDIDECNMSICSDTCRNTNGSFQCSCNSGFKLNEDNVTCVNINECATNNGNCTDRCIDEIGTYWCTENLANCENKTTKGSYVCLEKGQQAKAPVLSSQWKKCPCPCKALISMKGNNSFEMSIERSKDLQKKLRIRIDKLAAYKEREKTTIGDWRKSAIGLGVLWTLFVLIFLGLIVYCDVKVHGE